MGFGVRVWSLEIGGSEFGGGDMKTWKRGAAQPRTHSE